MWILGSIRISFAFEAESGEPAVGPAGFARGTSVETHAGVELQARFVRCDSEGAARGRMTQAGGDAEIVAVGRAEKIKIAVFAEETRHRFVEALQGSEIARGAVDGRGASARGQARVDRNIVGGRNLQVVIENGA